MISTERFDTEVVQHNIPWTGLTIRLKRLLEGSSRVDMSRLIEYALLTR